MFSLFLSKIEIMEFTNYLWLLRPASALLIAYFVTRQMRHFLLAVVTKLTPLNERFSQEAFFRQTRKVNIIGLFLTILLAALLDWGARKVMIAFPTNITNQANTLITPTPMPDLTPKTYEKTEPFATFPVPSMPEVTAPPIPPKPVEVVQSSPIYLQIAAFSQTKNAANLKAQRKKEGISKIWLGITPDNPNTQKVLIGPFPSTQKAMEFSQQSKIHGFPRPASDFHFIW